MRKPLIAVTMGDPGGIGPEIIAKALKDFEASDQYCYVLIGVRKAFDLVKSELGISLPLHSVKDVTREALDPGKINFLDVTDQAALLLRNAPAVKDLVPGDEASRAVFEIGKVSVINASMAFAAIKTAGYLASIGAVEALVTAPINKTSIRLLDPHFYGHTEFLANLSGVKRFAMMFVGEQLRVTLVTIHVPIKRVSQLITEKLVFEKIRLTDHYLRTYFNFEKPRLAVCALNPHGAETGDEETEIIEPAVRHARNEKIDVEGPLSADQLFYEAYHGHYDAVISMYHDQGLAPFKMISFRKGVNITLGLPYIRTSPDHGTAFDIAYQGKADFSSMKASLDMARELLLPEVKIGK